MLKAWAVECLPTDARVFDDRGEGPAVALAFVADRGALGFEARASLRLLLSGHSNVADDRVLLVHSLTLHNVYYT